MGEISPGAGEARLGETVRGPGRPVRAREGEPVLQEIRRCPARCGRARAPSSCEEVPVLLKVSGTEHGPPTRPRGGVGAGRGAHPDAGRRKSPKPHAILDRESSERTPGAPPGAPEDAAMGHGRGGAPRGANFAAICGTSGSGARQNAAPARTGRDTLPLFEALAPPGPRKPALPLEREANPPGFAGKWHESVRYFRSGGPGFWRFPGRRRDFARESR